MKKRDFETYQKRFRDFEILPKFSETHVFRGTIRHPYYSVHNLKRELSKLIIFRGFVYIHKTITTIRKF